MAANKKNLKATRSIDAANKKGVKLWFWLMIIGPAIFLLLYWVYSRPEEVPRTVKQPLPRTHLELGREASINNSSVVVGPDKKIYFTRTLQLKNNTVAAEPGRTFMVVPVQFPIDAGKPGTDQWLALDGEGNGYPLLKTSMENPVDNNNKEDHPTAIRTETVYQIYKIAKENTSIYIVLNMNDKKTAWKVK